MKKYILFALPILAACSQNVEPEIISALQMEITASISDDTRTAVISLLAAWRRNCRFQGKQQELLLHKYRV